uniref:(northern house mosquito) hypothetical protein n=1 Tax=Culex pipiens TaxID=7175 RepID=A0A8D8CK32_CULPI
MQFPVQSTHIKVAFKCSYSTSYPNDCQPQLKMKLKLVTLSLTILCLTATLAAPAERRRVKRQDMEQMKPWMEWGQKWGEVSKLTIQRRKLEEEVVVPFGRRVKYYFNAHSGHDRYHSGRPGSR